MEKHDWDELHRKIGLVSTSVKNLGVKSNEILQLTKKSRSYTIPKPHRNAIVNLHLASVMSLQWLDNVEKFIREHDDS